MKIHLYNYNLPIVFSYCEDVLEKMNCKIRHSDYSRGIISAAKDENVQSVSSLLDLKFSAGKFSVSIAIISSTLSNIFGYIYHDPVSEQNFIENVFVHLEAKEIIHPFKHQVDNYVEAIAV